MHPDRYNKIIELSDEYAKKKLAFECHQIANMPNDYDARIEATRNYYVAMADIIDAKNRLDHYINEGGIK